MPKTGLGKRPKKPSMNFVDDVKLDPSQVIFRPKSRSRRPKGVRGGRGRRV